jgi:hypothetical protein
MAEVGSAVVLPAVAAIIGAAVALAGRIGAARIVLDAAIAPDSG